MECAFRDVSLFHELADLPGADGPIVPPFRDEAERFQLLDLANRMAFSADMLKGSSSIAALRVRLMVEELAETIRAIANGELEEYADGLADLVYVAIGSAVQCGIPMPAVWAEVQRANVEKFPQCEACGGCGYLADCDEPAKCEPCKGIGRRVLRDSGGKILKPEGWEPPDIAAVLTAASAVARD